MNFNEDGSPNKLIKKESVAEGPIPTQSNLIIEVKKTGTIKDNLVRKTSLIDQYAMSL